MLVFFIADLSAEFKNLSVMEKLDSGVGNSLKSCEYPSVKPVYSKYKLFSFLFSIKQTRHVFVITSVLLDFKF